MTNQQDNGDEQSNDGKAGKKGQSFGTWLRQQRVVREIELREIAETSKISMRYLRALEEDRFEVLPASVFAKGFLRQYAKYVGLDPEEVVNFFITARQETESDDPPVVTKRKDATSPWTYLGIFFLLAALLLGVVWLTDRLGDQPSTDEPTNSSAAPTSATDPPATSTTGTIATTAGPAEASGASTANDPSASMPAGNEAQPSPANTPGANTPPTNTPGGAEVSSAVERDANSTDDTTVRPAAVQLTEGALVVTLDFSGDCWVEVMADGEPRVGEMRVQGESLRAVAEREIILKLGDVDAVEIDVNGFPYKVEPVAGSAVRTVRIDLETARSLAGGTAA